MIPALVLAALLAAGPAQAPAAGAADPLPDDPARPLLRARCATCHSVDYVTQQRLTPAQWQGTVQKMKRFGAVLTDAEAEQLSAYLGRSWPLDVPERRPAPVQAPKGAVAATTPGR